MKDKIKYHNTRDIIKSIKAGYECGIREKAFDWKEIKAKGFWNRSRIIKMCKRYGKIKLVSQGFILKLNR